MNRLFSTSAAIVSALAAMLVACSTDSTVPDFGRTPKTLTVTQEDAAGNNSTQTRSIITDQGKNGLNAIWKEGDVMSVYNRSYPSTAGFESITALSTSKNTAFIGKVTCEKDDELRLFYPAVKESGSVTTSGNGNLTLDISQQKGTLEDIQSHYDFNYSSAIVESVTEDQAVANAGKSHNLMAICKFTFNLNGEVLAGIKELYLENISTQATYTLGARHEPELTTTNTGKTITVKNVENQSGPFYFVMFPGANTPVFYLQTIDNKTYKASLSTATLKSGKFYNVTLSVSEANYADIHKDYIEICGVKWAKGNLIYDPSAQADNNFVDHYFLGKKQYYRLNDGTSSTKTINGKAMDCFYYGVFSNSGLSGTSWVSGCSGKMYLDWNGKTITTDFSKAETGDLAYWVSRGQYRLPTAQEANTLKQASYQYGYINVNGVKIYGYLYTNPVGGTRETNNTEKELTEADIAKGLFLPRTKTIQDNEGVDFGGNWEHLYLFIEKTCYYTDESFIESYPSVTEFYSYCIGDQGIVSKERNGGGNVDNYFPIRPVYCGDE